jgi:hydroxypyruvate isomerase
VDARWHTAGRTRIADGPGRHEPGTGRIDYPLAPGHIDRMGDRGAMGLARRAFPGRLG